VHPDDRRLELVGDRGRQTAGAIMSPRLMSISSASVIVID